MTARLYATQHTIPAMTSQANPAVQPVVLDDVVLDRMEILIPTGHQGLTGVAIQWSGMTIFPYVQGTFLVGSGEVIPFAYGGEITANGLAVAGFNLDQLPHTFYIRWHVSDRNPASPVIINSPQASATPSIDDIVAIKTLVSV